jgi:regulatory protein
MKKKLNVQEAREKINRYCAYQDRCHSEVRNKLYEYGLLRDEIDEIISSLITENYLNEERFAKAFAGGKFRMKKWGKLKIVNALESKGITKNCIKSAMKEIDDIDYYHTLTRLIEQKAAHVAEDNLYVKRDKLSNYLISKGYEPELVWKSLKEFLPD